MDNRERYRQAFVIAAGIALAVGAVFVARNYSLWILVPIPSAVGLAYHLLNLSSKFESRKSVVEAYRTFNERFDQAWSSTDTPTGVSEDLADDMDRHAPTLASMLWGAALLTAVFAIPAVISNGGRALKPTTDPRLEQVATALKTAQDAANATTPSTKAMTVALTNAQATLKEAQDGLPEWQRGLVFAGLGVWVFIVMRTVGRINAGGLNARFLITASLRAGAAMMLGFFAGSSAGATDFLDKSLIAGPTTYFLIGLFYPLFFEQLRDEAYQRFKRNKPITTELPTNWVDGVDDDTQDILTEVNVLNVQHLATADPGVLTMRSLLPFNRVVDLIDQAILISYFRDKIVVLRKFGVRGVMDFVSAMEAMIRKNGHRAEAEKAIGEIAKALDVSVEVLVTFGMSIYNDYRVNLLMRLWQHNVQAEGYTVAREPAAIAPAGAERIPIMAAGTPSYSAFRDFINDLISTELRREAAERAARFREENPDEPRPADDWLNTSFDDGYTAALKRATIGASPKASGPMKETYNQAFLGALK